MNKIARFQNLFFFFILMPTAAKATEWTYVTTSSTGAVWFYDSESIKDITDGFEKARKAWVKIDFTQDKNVKYRERKSLIYFQCESEQAKTVSGTTYVANGSVLDTYTPPFPVYSPVVPDTVLSAAMQRVCSQP